MADGRIVIDTAIDNSGAERGIQELQNRLDQLGTSLQQIGAGMTTSITLPLMAVGGAAMKFASDVDSATGRIQSGLGTTKKRAEELAGVAQAVFINGWGESLSEVSDAVANVIHNMGELNDADLSKVTQGAYFLAERFEADINETTRTAGQLMKDFGVDSSKAMDMITWGFQNGLDYTGEFLDTLREYSPQFSEMGYTGEQMLNTLKAGFDAGAWSLDKVGDSIKESHLRMSDMSEATKEAYKTLGLNAEEYVSKIAKGGEVGNKAFQEIVQALMNVEDATLRNQLSTDLFGTQYEDLREKVIFAMADAEKSIEGLEGTTKRAAEAFQDNFGERLQQTFRQLQEALVPLGMVLIDMVEQIIPKIESMVDGFSKWFEGLSSSGQNAVVIFGLIVGALGPLLMVLGLIVPGIVQLIGLLGGLSAPVLGVVAGIGLLVTALITAYSQSETFRNGVNKVFSAIKNIAVNVFQAVASFIGQKVSEIKSFWDSNGTHILNAVKNVFNGIKSVVDAVMPAVKFVIEMVWTAIKQVISGALNVIMGLVKTFSGLLTGDFSKMWEGIKQTFKGAIDLIIGWMTLSFVGGLRTLLTNLAKSGLQIVKGMWDNIVSTVSSLGSKVISTVRGLIDDVVRFFTNLYSRAVSIFTQLRTFGASVWNSLSQAIIGVARNIWNSVTTHFRNILSSVRNTMHNLKSTVVSIWNNVVNTFKGIDLYKVGRDIIQGLINGIGSMASAVWEKAKGIATGIVDKVKGALDIHSPSRVMIEVGENVGQGLAIGIANTEKDVEKQAEKLADIIVFNNKKVIQLSKYQMSEMNKIAEVALEERYQIFENWLNKQYELEYITLQDEIKLREYAVKQFGFYSEDRRKAELKLRDAKIKLFDDTLKREQEFTNRVESIWKNHYEQLESAEEDYLKKVKELNDKLIAEEKRLNDEYEKAVADRTKSLYSFVGLFDEVKEKSEVTGQQLLNNLKGQVDTFKDWREGIENLAKRGIDEDLLIELRGMGPSAASEIDALNSLTDEQLNEYVKLWREKNRLAREQAINELSGLKSDTETKIQELRASTAQELESVRVEWQNKFVEISNNTKSELEALAEEMPDMGKDVISKLIDGVNEKAPELIALAESLGEDFSKALNKGMSKLDYYASGGGSSYVSETALPGSSSNTLVKGSDGKYYTWEEYNDKFQSGSKKSSSSGSSSGKLSNIVKDTVKKIADTAKKIVKFHDGGHVGGNGNLRFDEMMAILKKGEYVVSEEDVKKIASLSVPSINSLYSGIGNGLNPVISNNASSKVDNSRHSHVIVNAGLGAREIANETEKALNRLAFRMG